MNRVLHVANRQRYRILNLAYLRKIVISVVREDLQPADYELGVYLVSAPEITRLNESHLGHEGPTDVITFDYQDPSRPGWLAGDIFVCVQVAVEQAGEFGATWQEEVVRYIVHGLLHLQGYDDKSEAARRRMKPEEDRFVRRLCTRFNLKLISAK